MSHDNKIEEIGVETQEVLRFLIKDHAFDVEFLITAIQEYYANNKGGNDASSSRKSRS